MNLLVESLLRRVVSVENLFTHGGGFCTVSLVACVPKHCILPVNLKYTLCTLSILQINEPLTDSTARGTAPPILPKVIKLAFCSSSYPHTKSQLTG